MARIKDFSGGVTGAIFVLAEGNIGAATALMEIVKQGNDIDPDSALGSWGFMLDLDTCGIYGSKIWLLYKDVSFKNLETMLGCLRAVQLGIKPCEWLIALIEKANVSVLTDADRSDVLEAVSKVKKRLPAFGAKEKGGA